MHKRVNGSGSRAELTISQHARRIGVTLSRETPLELVRTSVADTPLIQVEGDVDHATAAALEAAVSDAVDEGHHVILDLAACPYLDSAGLALLLVTARRLRGSGWVGVVGSSKNVYRLLEIVGLTTDPAFRVFGDLDSATRSLVADTPQTA